jgi:hypothetical protein
MFDAEKFRRTKAQECGRFAAASVDGDDRLFWSRRSEQWLELANGSERNRSDDASSASYRAIESFAEILRSGRSGAESASNSKRTPK